MTAPPLRCTLFPYTTLFRSTIYAKVKAHRHETPTPIRERNPDVPEAFAAIVHKLLAKAPADRYASRSEEHTSELQSLTNLVCRLLLEKKKSSTSILHEPRHT